MPIAEAIAAVTAAIEVAKGMRAAEKNFDAATYKIQIADLMTALSDARLELISAREAVVEKDAEMNRLKDLSARQGELVAARGGFKYAADADKNPTGYPVCPTCEHRDGRLTFTVSDGTSRKVRCPVCDSRFDGVNVYATRPATEPVTLAEDDMRRQAEGMDRLAQRLRDRGSNFV